MAQGRGLWGGPYDWVEKLLMALALGVVILLAVPVIRNTQISHRDNSVVQTLKILRKALEAYQADHSGGVPPTPEAFVLAMTASSGKAPYLPAIPPSGINAYNRVAEAPSLKVGWVYRVRGGKAEIRAVNSAGNSTLDY